jgi:hypothetical protein
MSVSRSRESNVRRHTASMALALAWLRNTSPGCAVSRSVFTATSRAHTFTAVRKRVHGGKIVAAPPIVIR